MKNLCWKGKAFKVLSYGIKQKAGRNFSGSITIFHRGGGSKKLLRRVDFHRNTIAKGLVERIEYDPNRTAQLALIRWSNIIKSHQVRSNLASQSFISDGLSVPSSNLKALYQARRDLTQRREASTKRFFSLIKTKSAVTLKKRREAENSKKARSFCLRFEECSTTRRGPFSPSYASPKGVELLQTPPLMVPKSKSAEGSKTNVKSPTGSFCFAPFSYILASDQLKSGDEVLNITSTSSPAFEKMLVANEVAQQLSEPFYQKSGNSLPIELIPIGSLIHNVEFVSGAGGRAARSAGTFAQLVQKAYAGKGSIGKNNRAEGDAIAQAQCIIRLPSGCLRQVPSSSIRATIGAVMRIDHKSQKLTKAGQTRWLGFRPVVRGVAMNPIDHPHGGGEGRTKGGRPSVSPWGKPTKGSKRRNEVRVVNGR